MANVCKVCGCEQCICNDGETDVMRLRAKLAAAETTIRQYESAANSWYEVEHFMAKLPMFKIVSDELVNDQCFSMPTIIIKTVERFIERSQELEAAEKERDKLMLKLAAVIEVGKKQSVDCDYEVGNLMAHNAVLRGALERCRKAFVNLIDLSLLPSEEYEKETNELAQMCFSALSATPSDSAAKVQQLVDVLELVESWGPTELAKRAGDALAEWRGE